jgi:adenine-specific DNA-methyltransferase
MAQLTEQEIQEIIRFLEAGKSLPDKYRFLVFDDKREVELVWNGKTNEVTNAVLPFQVIEQVDEPRAEKKSNIQMDIFDVDGRGRQLQGWTNKLVWGDNKLILSSLKNGSIRDEIEKNGGLKLVYIDPPFDVGADFSMDVEIGEDTFTKRPNILEEIAYRDTWGKGQDSFLAMIYERLLIIKDLLAEDGSLFLHCDWRLNSAIRLILNEIFGIDNFRNEIIWRKTNSPKFQSIGLGNQYDSILVYAKSNKTKFSKVFRPFDEKSLKPYSYEDDRGKYRLIEIEAQGVQRSPNRKQFEFKGRTAPYLYNIDQLNEWDRTGMIYESSGGRYSKKQYLEDLEGVLVSDLWTDEGVSPLQGSRPEVTGYPTQKPESLLERVIQFATEEGDLVADFFCGSGTTPAVAEKLGRKWIASDLGKFAIHTTRKRLIQTQRELKANDKEYRAFEILNLGKYERQHYIGVNQSLREIDQQKQLESKEREFVELVLEAYRADITEGFKTFQGKKSGRLVAVGPVNIPVTRLFVEEVILECREKKITRVDILGFEFEMGLFPNVLDEARQKGIDISPKHIPVEVFDKRAVEKNQVIFHDVASIEVKPIIKKNEVTIQLTDFSVFYSQDSVSTVEAGLKDKSEKIVVERGQIVKVSKDKNGIVTREQLTKNWIDWIDYWAVDFNFESKREIHKLLNEATGKMEEVWTGDYIFENEWQSFRTKKDRNIELLSVPHEIPNGLRKIAIKVVDIFGNDTMTILEVNIGGKK